MKRVEVPEVETPSEDCLGLPTGQYAAEEESGRQAATTAH
jgi:hypothetical protein